MKSSEADLIIQELRALGCAMEIATDGKLILTGSELSDELLERVRKNKASIVTRVRSAGAASKVRPDTWAVLRRLANRLGGEVDTGEPWGKGVLWGISPRGATVDVGPVLVTFDLETVN